VAPGFLWSKFDQELHDELQPIWVGILLWKDIQIRLTVVRPTFPVMAFEAPGALGCEIPANVVRRSDSSAGWEYAQAESHAIAIQRLISYDAQRVSAPFLDQSNINVAYSYSEQPTVYESQASVAARCLAAASLVRPLPFDPGIEFGGIKVATELPEIFRVTLPEGRSAFVAPGETTPTRIKMNEVEFEGTALRYVQLTEDLDEICGLGITRIDKIASFTTPGMFRLKRESSGETRLTTNTGISLSEQWLHGQSRCIEVQTLDRQWLDVTALCVNGSIPLQVVQEWSERNQRSLVEFRIKV
jgi:hypothetical protein